LWRLGDNLSQKVLANALEIELASLMRTLAQLEQQGLIERHCCPHDKRARLVNLTPAGLDLITKVEVTIINIRSQLLLGINAEELTEFERVINLIGNNALTKLAKMTDK
ncbi:MarR family transcriptional regulator, partial [Vibrio sp. 10N.222.55.C6]